MEDIKEQISEQEVNQVLNAFDFLEFSNSYRNAYSNMYFTPDIINKRIQDVNMNPVEATVDGIESALKNPKDSESILRGYAMNIENTNMYYKRLIRYFSDMASFNLNYDCINATKLSDYKSKEYKEDLFVLDDFCSKFDFKTEFSTVFRQILRQGVEYSVLRMDSDKYTLQELPAEFCQITGRHAYGLLYDFNMQWFIDDYGADINMYPRVFKRMYRQVFKKISQDYNPHMPVDKRDSTYVYWHQCSPTDGFWAWKISPEVATLLPYFAPMFSDISFQPVARRLQQDKYFIEASKLLVGILGFNKEAKTGQVANQLNMSPDILGKFLGVARQGLNKQIGLVALPVDDIKAVDFSVDQSNIITDYTNSISRQGLAASDVLMADDKLNSHQSKLASAIDANFVKAVYGMFSDFVDYYVNLRTKKYKFHVSFHDVDIPDDRAERENRFKTFASMGIVDIQYAARVFDMTPFEFDRRLAMSKSSGLENKLISLVSLNNQSVTLQQGVGRPSKANDPTADNENTQASWDRDSNSLK